MTATRYDAIAVRKYTDRDGNEKSQFTTIGVAFPMKDRDGFNVSLHAFPVPTDGEFRILLMPPRPRDGQQDSAPRQTQTSPLNRVGLDPDDSEIPF